LGRVLFYDKNLSVNNTISCASCHKQEFAVGDTAVSSLGVDNGRTERHSMRLINTRYANEAKFFWNERAASLEAQVTMPIVDHLEMGFSGQTGRGHPTTSHHGPTRLNTVPTFPLESSDPLVGVPHILYWLHRPRQVSDPSLRRPS